MAAVLDEDRPERFGVGDVEGIQILAEVSGEAPAKAGAVLERASALDVDVARAPPLR